MTWSSDVDDPVKLLLGEPTSPCSQHEWSHEITLETVCLPLPFCKSHVGEGPASTFIGEVDSSQEAVSVHRGWITIFS